jgi:hypothetical protein
MGKSLGVRRSQVIVPFGVGAILDVGNNSFVAADITKWNSSRLTEIRLDRLKRRLGKRLLEPPVPLNPFQNNPETVPYCRFPTWFFCSKCRFMRHWTSGNTRELGRPNCQSPGCHNRALVPMRFVVACENGHLDEVPWSIWAHSHRDIAGNGRCEIRNELKFTAKQGSGGGLASLEILCGACNSKRSLEGITNRIGLAQLGMKCRGRQPWERFDLRRECNADPIVLQRGAGNLYYPLSVSALDIPEPGDDSNSLIIEEIRRHNYFPRLQNQCKHTTGDIEHELPLFLAGEIARSVQCERDLVLTEARDSLATDALPPAPFSESDVMYEEWLSLCSPPSLDVSVDAHFQAEPADISAVSKKYGLDKLITDLILVRRLREVRALRGFHRIMPGDDERLVPVDLDKGEDWIPAVEIFGEGLFLRFSETALQEWENSYKSAFLERQAHFTFNIEKNKFVFLPAPTARFTMLHTVSHLLIRQLAFECGYSSSALRERIYVSQADDEGDAMAGILIYTADSDSEGSMGGLVREGEPQRFIPTFIEALETAAWCSSDPICRELDSQGLGGLNSAACHACCLVSETSCAYSNTLLDRRLSTGGGDELPWKGYFEDFMTAVRDEKGVNLALAK